MKTALVMVTAFLMIILFVSGVKAGDPTEPGQTYKVELGVGEVFNVCQSGIVVCPALVSICDDTSIVTLVETPDGLGFRGVAPGATLCSVGTAVGPRRLFRVTVQ